MAVTCLFVGQARAQLEPSVENYLQSDRNYNVVQRLRTEKKAKKAMMSDEDKEPTPVDFFEASAEQLGSQFYLSQFVSPEDLKSVQQENGKFLIPCLKKDKATWWLLRAKFGEPVLQSTAYKVLSRATYYIEPVGDLAGFFAKFTPHVPGMSQKIEREVLVNDYIQTQLPNLPPEMRNLSMDSFMGLNLSVLGIPVSIGYRSALRIRNKPEHILPYPGHGLLGCEDCVREYAQKWSGIFDEDKAIANWKTQELLPKLAKNLAYAHHVLGVSFEAHTQNIEIDINKYTGEIVGLSNRDYADVLLNPLPLIADGRLPENLDWERVKLISMHPHYFSDHSTEIARDIWYHASIYSGQGVTSHLKGFQRQQSYLLQFLQAYLKETEKILGDKIELSEDAQNVLKRLENGTIRENSGELQERSHLRNAMASVLKPIFEEIYRRKTLQIEESLKNALVRQDQEQLKKIFFNALVRQKLVYMGREGRTQLIGPDTKNSWLRATIAAYVGFGFGKKKNLDNIVFKLHEGRLFAVDATTQKPLAMMLETFQEPSSWLNRLFKKPTPSSSNSSGLRCLSAHRGSL